MAVTTWRPLHLLMGSLAKDHFSSWCPGTLVLTSTPSWPQIYIWTFIFSRPPWYISAFQKGTWEQARPQSPSCLNSPQTLSPSDFKLFPDLDRWGEGFKAFQPSFTEAGLGRGASNTMGWVGWFFFVLFQGWFWQLYVAYGILVPQPGIKPKPMAVKVLSPNHQTTRGIPQRVFFIFF